MPTEENQNPQQPITRCGYVAIVGRPNVGKSTLMNHLLGQKISITSRKPQTTRHQILGIKTEQDTQIIFVDTPGMHLGQKKAINRYMNRAASTAIKDVDVVVFVVDQLRWTDEDQMVLEQLKKVKCPVVLVINKVDKLEDKEALLPHIAKLSEMREFDRVFPMSALRGHNIDDLEEYLLELMPEGIHFFPEDQITDRSERFVAAEIIREKIMRQLGAELPYDIAVEIENWEVKGTVLHIHALILVDRAGQKRIVIGDKGSRLRQIGMDARKDLEELLGIQVMLNLWVKVKSGWADDERALRSLGYRDE
jgi:GTP-binding protein Era